MFFLVLIMKFNNNLKNPTLYVVGRFSSKNGRPLNSILNLAAGWKGV